MFVSRDMLLAIRAGLRYKSTSPPVSKKRLHDR